MAPVTPATSSSSAAPKGKQLAKDDDGDDNMDPVESDDEDEEEKILRLQNQNEQLNAQMAAILEASKKADEQNQERFNHLYA